MRQLGWLWMTWSCWVIYRETSMRMRTEEASLRRYSGPATFPGSCIEVCLYITVSLHAHHSGVWEIGKIGKGKILSVLTRELTSFEAVKFINAQRFSKLT